MLSMELNVAYDGVIYLISLVNCLDFSFVFIGKKTTFYKANNVSEY